MPSDMLQAWVQSRPTPPPPGSEPRYFIKPFDPKTGIIEAGFNDRSGDFTYEIEGNADTPRKDVAKGMLLGELSMQVKDVDRACNALKNVHTRNASLVECAEKEGLNEMLDTGKIFMAQASLGKMLLDLETCKKMIEGAGDDLRAQGFGVKLDEIEDSDPPEDQ